MLKPNFKKADGLGINCSTLKKTIFEKKWLFDFTYLLFAQLTKLPFRRVARVENCNTI